MSSTTTTVAPPAPAQATVPPPEPLWTPQFIISLIAMGLVTGTVAGVFMKGDPPTLQLVIGLVIGSFGKDVIGFYFNSSKNSQAKDATIAALAGAAPPPGATTTSTTTTTSPTTPPAAPAPGATP